MPARPIRIAAAALALLAVGCGSDSDNEQGAPVDTAEAVVSLVEDAGFRVSDAPPSDLTVIDIRVGDGAEASAGAAVTVHYSVVSWSTGQLVDSSWQRNTPFVFPLGKGRVITGWDEGVAGMREGGQRLLILPPQFAYGDMGTPSIGPGETLIFVVDVLSLD